MNEAKPRTSKVLPVTPDQERAYHRAMAKLTAERGYLNLSQAHALAALDCSAGCPCPGCERTREEAAEARAVRDARRKQAAPRWMEHAA